MSILRLLWFISNIVLRATHSTKLCRCPRSQAQDIFQKAIQDPLKRTHPEHPDPFALVQT